MPPARDPAAPPPPVRRAATCPAGRRSIGEADAAAGALDDLALLFEHASADGIPIRSVVGEEPADVAEALLENHLDGSWNAAMRAALTAAIDAA